MPLLYDELADWWPLLSRPEDYAEEARFFGDRLREACRGEARTLLELGSGGGNNASHLKERFELTLVDQAPAMLAVSEKLNPECQHRPGDMRSIRLDRKFDLVFIHDAIAYLTSEDELRQAFDTAFLHCRPGGAALFAPDHLRETFESGTESGGHDGDDGRALRYLAWTRDPDPSDSTYTVDYAYLLQDADGAVRTVHDRHLEGLFSRSTWRRQIEAAGFEVRSLQFDHSEVEPGSYEIFVASRPDP
ncbi:MAG: class I SAM-dependent methyltransferase [Acidobacteriota bacterium]